MEPSCLVESSYTIGSILRSLEAQDRFGPGVGFPVFYFLGLAAAGLLAVPKNRTRPLILLLLATLWTTMAVGYHVSSLRSGNPLVHNATELLALVQAMLFIAVIAKPDAARFEPRDGSPWRLAGSALLLYALAIYPLLGTLTGGRAVGMYIAGLPFPPLVLTLGILFFLAKPLPPLLVVPLLGAATGGIAGMRLDDAHLWALRLVFVAGCLFAFLPWETWGGREKRKVLYEELQGRRAAYEARLMVPVLAVLALFFAWEHGAPLDPILHQLSTSLGLLAVAGLVLWMAFPAWLNPGFRMVAWPVAKGAGRLWVWFKDAWKWIALLLVTVSLVDYVTLKTIKESLFDERTLVVFLAAAFLLWLVYLAYQGRNRLVIQPFEANTEDENLKKYVKGVQAQLRNDLARISDLYHVIDEVRPEPSGEAVKVTVEVQDVGEILKEAAAPLKLFKGVELPTDFLFSLASRLVKGPRITGSLYGGGKKPVLVAELSGGRMPGNWQVGVDALDQDKRDLPMEGLLQAMTEQLAFRIATQVVSIGSPRWQAVRCFTEGLRRYRDTQRTEKGRDVKLREAERCLLAAAKEDDKFAQSHYNLGVVYRTLYELGSAKSAFRRALREDPRSYEACYGLAETSVEADEYEETLQFCEAAIGINPADARAWGLKGYAWRQREEKRQGIKSLALPPDDPIWPKVLPWQEVATALAWRRLCRSALAGPSPILEREQETTVLCTRNLAVILSRMGRHEESRLVVRQAIGLAAHDPELRFVLGRILYLEAQWSEAKAALTRGLDDNTTDLIERSLKWATLTRVYTQEDSPAEARTALKRLLDLTASVADPKELETWSKALDDCLMYPGQESFAKSQSRLKALEEPPLDKVPQAFIRRLKDAYGKLADLGIGSDRIGAAWLKQILRFQAVLESLHPENGSTPSPTRKDPVRPTPFKSLQGILARPDVMNCGSDADLLRLEGLRDVLRDFLPQGETRIVYFHRVRQNASYYLFAPAKPHEQILKELGLKPDDPETYVLAHLVGLYEAVTDVASHLPASEADGKLQPLLALFSECLDDAVLGWEWAYCQVQVKLARLLLERGETEARQSSHTEEARAALADAIPRLESHGFQQPQEQGLQALFARATLACAEDRPRDDPDRVQLLRHALAHARRAAELNPESARDRVSLVKVYSALGDYEQAKEESDLCIAMDSSPEVLRLVGSCFWNQAAAASGRATREAALKEAVNFFDRTLELIEKQAFQRDKPFEQIQSHAWGHYWLGRFHCELLEHEKGTPHQEIARSMGFKPLESCVNLGLAYLDDGDLDRAQAAFAEAKQVAGRNQSRQVADGEGEDRPIHELLFEVHLGEARLHLKRCLEPDGAKAFVDEAGALIDKIDDPEKHTSCQSAIHEALAWIHFRAGRLPESRKEARRSLELAARGGAYLCLAKALMEDNRLLKDGRQSAREACDRASRADTRGLWKKDIDALLAQLGRLRAQERPAAGVTGENSSSSNP